MQPASHFLYPLQSRTIAFIARTNNFEGSSGPRAFQEGPVPVAQHIYSSVVVHALTDPETQGGATQSFRVDQPIALDVKLIANTPFPVKVHSMQLDPNLQQGVMPLTGFAPPSFHSYLSDSATILLCSFLPSVPYLLTQLLARSLCQSLSHSLTHSPPSPPLFNDTLPSSLTHPLTH